VPDIKYLDNGKVSIIRLWRKK